MTRRSFFATLTAVLMLTMTALADRAQAQGFPVGNTCCSFVVVASCNLPANCFPITVVTTWAGTAQTDFKAGCGGTVFPITTGPCPPVPATLDGVTIDGTAVGFPGPTYITLACGTCARVSVGYDPITGCPRIQISVCP